ncbi:hypothetical protein V3C99_014247 [Haemonchus contortus]
MHLYITFVMFCVLLLTRGYAELECKSKVGPKLRNRLLEAINEKCSPMPGNRVQFNNGSYDCKLEQTAFEGGLSGGPGPSYLFSFDGRSTFNGHWRRSLEEALNDADKNDTVSHSPPEWSNFS